MRIYKGNIRCMNVKNLSINAQGIKVLEYETPVIKKDSLFYVNFWNKLVSFEHDMPLPSFEEAYDVCLKIACDNPDKPHLAYCLFHNEEELEFVENTSKEQFKELKKLYKRSKN